MTEAELKQHAEKLVGLEVFPEIGDRAETKAGDRYCEVISGAVIEPDGLIDIRQHHWWHETFEVALHAYEKALKGYRKGIEGNTLYWRCPPQINRHKGRYAVYSRLVIA